MTLRAYRWLVLHSPANVLAVLLAAALFMGAQLRGLELDAGSQSLVLEDDPEQRVYDRSRLVFGSDEYLIVAGRDAGLFTPEGVARLRDLTARLEALDGIGSVLSPTNVRLFRSSEDPPGMLGMLFADPVRLDSEECDLGRARAELTGHRLYGENLVAADGEHFALYATLARDPEGLRSEEEVYRLQEALEDPGLTVDGRAGLEAELAAARTTYLGHERVRKAARLRAVDEAWRVLESASTGDGGGRAYRMSGLPMVIAEMIRYLDGDLRVFGAAALALVTGLLALVFRRVAWVLLPLFSCLVTVALVMGAMVLADRKTTVITANVSSLLLIITLAHAVHLIVRYQESTGDDRLGSTLAALARPCLYTAITTCAGFGSLWISRIRPVMDFGVFMSWGTLAAFVVSFLVFPAWVTLMPPREASRLESHPARSLARLAGWTLRWRAWIVAASLLLFAAGGWGMTRIVAETRFIDYFREGTRLHQGLDFVDRHLGGTTTLEVIVEGPEEGYFRSGARLREVLELKDYLMENPAVGKVLTLPDVLKEFRDVMAGLGLEEVPTAELVHQAETILGRETLRSYATADYRSTRVFVRIRESAPTLERGRLLEELGAALEARGWFPGARVEVTGIFVLYTNMLRSLVDSQERSLGLVLAAIGAMLWVLFRSLRLAAIAMVPNLLPVVLVLGVMGWTGVPLDMSTLMIAGVSLGMAVDGSIHYLTRFRSEFAATGDYRGALELAHGSIGRAIVYTAVSVILGFSVLGLSSFKPTVYFGLLTSLSMAAALFGSLTLLPALVLILRPLGPRHAPAPEAPR
ncbi:MAG: MMPL family transporter [Planctomycetes bacterium]|nr:MMPL family transporter [Planctomycetota bacterium]